MEYEVNNHTPGPWRLKQTDGQDFTAIETLDAVEVLGTSEWLRAEPNDLKLIAAAPKMYEALTNIIMAVGYTIREPDVEKAILEGFLALEEANDGVKGNLATEEGNRERAKLNFLCDGLEEMNNKAKGEAE